MVLSINEYDISYFDGNKVLYQNNAGYSKYTKWFRINDDFLPHVESTGEYWSDMAKWLIQTYDLVGKKVLDLGCAKGFVVEALRDMGVDAYGFDISDYALGCAREDIKQYLIKGNIVTDLSQFKNKEFDFVFSRWTLECIDLKDIPNVIRELNRISKLQLHSIDISIKPEYYTRIPITDWSKLGFNRGTLLTSHYQFKNLITV